MVAVQSHSAICVHISTRHSDAEERHEEEELPDNSGAILMESALEELELARHHLTAVEEKACHSNTTHAALFT